MYTHHNVHYEFEKGEIAKSRTLAGKYLVWMECLAKWSRPYVCEKFCKQCQRKNHEDNHIPNGYYLKKIGGSFDDKYIEYKSEVNVKP